VVKLPRDALAQLGQLRATLVERGEVFWLPGAVVVYRTSDKRRPCLVAALDNARAHLVPGTSQTARGPAVVVEVGETDLPKRTEFDFSVSFPLTLADLVAQGRPAGALPADRLADIDAAVAASNLVALKRLMRS
jgi:mRNA-degrading endonuclease toxin of MazEF toxin-antitoxin module